MLISTFLTFKHGWDAFQPAQPAQVKMMTDLGINASIVPYFGVLLLIIGVMLFFPQTFFISNLVNAILILLIMALSLRGGNIKMALIEIPFLTLPLVLIWLKYPIKF